MGIHLVQDAVPSHNSRPLILAYHHPAHLISFKGTLEAVKRAKLQQAPVLLHKRNLFLYSLYFFFGQLVQIQFIAKCPKICHICPRMERGLAVYLVVGRHRHMGADAADGITQGGAILDLHPLHRIRVIACPSLRRIIQHAWVEPAAPAGTGLKEYMREFLRQPLVQLIDAKDITVEHFPLPVCRQGLAIALGNAAVHIPFNIRNFCLPQDGGHHPINRVHNLRPGEIQYILIPAVASGAVRGLQQPVWVAAVEV